MNKKIYFGLAAAAMLTACSQEEVIDMNMDGDVISIKAAAETQTRASESYCNHVMPSTIFLSAVHTGEDSQNSGIYFLNNEMTQFPNRELDGSVNYGGPSIYTFTNGDQYWPENKLNFYAWHSTDSNVKFSLQNEESGTIAKFEDFTVAENVKDQTDLLYATAFNAQKSIVSVNMTFDHALSQVVFKSRLENDNIDIEIFEIGIDNIYNTGSFVWPTHEQKVDLAKSAKAEEVTYLPCGWSIKENSEPTACYSVNVGNEDCGIKVEHFAEGVKGATALTAAPEDHAAENGWDNVLQLMPQRTERVYLGLGESVKPQFDATQFSVPVIKENKVMLKLRCKITAKNADNDDVVMLYDDVDAEGNTKYVYIPMDIDWQPGYRYVYTLTFSRSGSGGLDDPEGNPVLVNIRVNADVNEYDEVSDNIYDLTYAIAVIK